MSPLTPALLEMRDFGKLSDQLMRSCANSLSIATPFTNQQNGVNYVYIPGGIPVGQVSGDTSNIRFDLNYDPIKCLIDSFVAGQSDYQLSLAVGGDFYQCTSFMPDFHHIFDRDRNSPYGISCNVAAASLPDDTDITLSVKTSSGFTRAIGTVHTFVATPARACAKSIANSLNLRSALPQSKKYRISNDEPFDFHLPYNKYACSFDRVNLVFSWGSRTYPDFLSAYYFINPFEQGPPSHISDVGVVSGQFGAAASNIIITTGSQVPTRGSIPAGEYSLNIFVIDQPAGPFTSRPIGVGPVNTPGSPYRFTISH